MASKKLVRVYVVIADGKGEGPACDGTFVHRFRSQKEADDFAGKSTHYGRPATVQVDEVPRSLAERWGCA